MPSDVPGIHHVTAVRSDPGRNLDFYTETPGLRLVKERLVLPTWLADRRDEIEAGLPDL